MKRRICNDIVRETVESMEFTDVRVDWAKKSEKPNVVYIVLDDLGFAQLGCYGSTIHTPNIDKLASEGLRYNNFHTTAICSATRASLLTGANHHSVGVGGVVEFLTGSDNGIGHVKPEYATIAEILQNEGYGTYAIGKWHLADVAETTPAGPFTHWPLSKGFDHYYGFLHGQDDQYYPKLVRDNTHVSAPSTPEEGYHLTKDLADNAINYISTQINCYPEKPFFLYFAPGAMHTPHHVPKEYADRYKGQFDAGWDVLREQWLENQKRLGVVPNDAELTPRNERVPAWDTLSEKEKAVFAREMEVFAGFLEHTDEQIGRILDYLRQTELIDNTVIVLISDNGASADAGVNGAYNSFDFNSTIDEIYSHIDELGLPGSFNHYSEGWANLGNTPFPWYKEWTHSGGVKDPMIIRYPKLIKHAGRVVYDYAHVIDVTPTVLDIVDIKKPSHIKGVPQQPFHGISLVDSFDEDKKDGKKHQVQYYEMLGNRAIYADGWRAVTNHIGVKPSRKLSEDKWELYHVESDYSECHDVAEQYPEKLEELKNRWFVEAGKYGVFPEMEGNNHFAIKNERFGEYHNLTVPVDIPRGLFSDLSFNSYLFQAKVLRDSVHQEGVILSNGDISGGFSLYIKDNKLKYAYSSWRTAYYTGESDKLPVGELDIRLLYVRTGMEYGTAYIYINGQKSFEVKVEKLAYYFDFIATIGNNKYSSVIPQEYTAPFPFEGTIKWAKLQVEGNEDDAETAIEKLLVAD